MLIGFLLILALLIIRYKIVYKVTLNGEELGYIDSLKEFSASIEEKIFNQEEDIVYIALKNEPEYKMELMNRASSTDEEKVLEKIKQTDTEIMYKYYEVTLNNETKAYVNTLNEAKTLVGEIEQEYNDKEELELQINEKYSETKEEIETESVEIATKQIEKVADRIEAENNAIAIINDVRLAYLPVSGRITSRYGESSSLRRSRHTGIDIASESGTPIKAVSTGKVIFAGKNGSYGNLVKIEHKNGIETWYGHCKKIYVKEGDEVLSGDIIAAVGSTRKFNRTAFTF